MGMLIITWRHAFSVVKRIDIISDRMLYTLLRGHSCDITVLNVCATEDKSDDTKNSIYKELEQVFNQFLKYHMEILLGDFNIKAGKEDISKPTTGNESLHEISNDSGFTGINFATSKGLTVKNTMFPH
jgi:exonuclease III